MSVSHTVHRFNGDSNFVIMILSVKQVYLQSTEDLPVTEVRPQHVWDQKIQSINFSPKQTYTTEKTRQLTLQQRKCVFDDEITLLTSDTYTYNSCIIQCHMELARRLCKCVPFFYRKTGTYFTSYSHF
jgi:amiloride-sensitive sodium channel